MTLKHENLEPVVGNAFANCKLNRKVYAEVLTALVENYSAGFVLAINNKWGTGKTTFIKMWEQDLKDQGFQTIYFNAWENDFENSPLTALMGELKTLESKENKKDFITLLKSASKISKHLAPTLVKAVAERYINIDTLTQAIVDVTKGMNEIFENDVKEYAEKKDGLKQFKSNLATFIANTNSDKSIIFIIDELDRCRPDYAISILEQIKHFFSVPNIVFVLSIDKTQLGNAVCGVYGSDKIDSDEYLKRFIDVEYSIPSPSPELFYKYLYSYFKFDDYFETKRKEQRELQNDKGNFLNLCEILFNSSEITLRQQEKIFAHARLALRGFGEYSYVVPTLFLFLVYLKVLRTDLFNKIHEKAISFENLQKEFFEIVENRITNDNEREFIWLEAFLLNSYNIHLNYSIGRNLYKYDNGKNILLVTSLIDKSFENTVFLSVLETMRNSEKGADVNISHLTKKINLTETFQT